MEQKIKMDLLNLLNKLENDNKIMYKLSANMHLMRILLAFFFFFIITACTIILLSSFCKFTAILCLNTHKALIYFIFLAPGLLYIMTSP